MKKQKLKLLTIMLLGMFLMTNIPLHTQASTSYYLKVTVHKVGLIEAEGYKNDGLTGVAEGVSLVELASGVPGLGTLYEMSYDAVQTYDTCADNPYVVVEQYRYYDGLVASGQSSSYSDMCEASTSNAYSTYGAIHDFSDYSKTFTVQEGDVILTSFMEDDGIWGADDNLVTLRFDVDNLGSCETNGIWSNRYNSIAMDSGTPCDNYVDMIVMQTFQKDTIHCVSGTSLCWRDNYWNALNFDVKLYSVTTGGGGGGGGWI